MKKGTHCQVSTISTVMKAPMLFVSQGTPGRPAAISPALMGPTASLNMTRPTTKATTTGLSIIGNLSGVPAIIIITESLRKDVRGVGLATIYATAVAVFGGTTQPIVAWLDQVTGNPLAIAWYLIAGTLVGLIASILMVETVQRPRRAG